MGLTDSQYTTNSSIASNDANFKGATVRANDTLNLTVGNNLNIESVRDSSTSTSHGMNASIGVSASGNNSSLSGANASIGSNNSQSSEKQTVLTSLTGDSVNITVGENTNLKGSLVAAGNTDESGVFQDNQNLNLSTKTLTFENSTNTKSSNSQGLGMGVGVNPQGDISSASMQLSTGTSYERTKTLATLGQGNINIIDKANSDDLARLNTDTTQVDKSLFKTNTGTSASGTLDTRLLTAEGRAKIAEDVKKASTMVDAINQIATTDRAGILDFFNETEKNVKVLDGIKSTIANNPTLATQLSDPNLTPEQKQSMLGDIASSVAISLGYIPASTKLVYTDETGADNEQIKGHYSMQTDTSYINDKNNNSTIELVSTTGHETQHAMDTQANINTTNKTDNEQYATNFGNMVADYTDYAVGYTGNQTTADTNNHNGALTLESHAQTVNVVFDKTLNQNNKEFAGLDKELGEDSVSKIVVTVNKFDGKTNQGTAQVYVEDEKNPTLINITTGQNTSDQSKKNAGPTPAGTYVIDPSKSQNMNFVDRLLGINQGSSEMSLINLLRVNPLGVGWGDFRVPLQPASMTNTYNRTNMYIHGGSSPGSIGCIDCGNTKDQWLFQQIRDTNHLIPVEIKYGK